MNIKIIPDNFDQNIYNQKAPHPLQSWEWGEARQKTGIEVLRIGEFKGENLINVFQTTFHKIPHTDFKIGYLPRSVFPSENMLNFLHDYGSKKKVIFLKIEPYEKKVLNHKFPQIGIPLRGTKILNPSPHPLFPKWTIQLDLTKSEDELLKNMHPKTRYNLRLARKKGVVVREMTDHRGFVIFSKLYFETCRRQKYFGHDFDYHQTVFETLKDNIAHILIAFYKETPLAAYEVFTFNDVLYYPYGGSSLEYRNLMAANLLMWETIKFGQKMGCRTFDMWGSLPPDYNQKNPWAGFTRFKEGYGGRFVELAGSYDLVINQYLYKFYNLAHRLRQPLLTLIR